MKTDETTFSMIVMAAEQADMASQVVMKDSVATISIDQWSKPRLKFISKCKKKKKKKKKNVENEE